MNLLGEFSNASRKAGGDEEEEDFAMSPTFPDVHTVTDGDADKEALKKNVSDPTVQQITDPSLDHHEKLPKVSKKTEQAEEDIDVETLSNSSEVNRAYGSDNVRRPMIKKRALQTTNSSLQQNKEQPLNITQNVGQTKEVDSGHPSNSSKVQMTD